MKVKRVAWVSALVFGLCSISDMACSAPGSSGSGQAPKPSPAGVKAPQPGEKWTNPKDGSFLVWIPGGEFMMGSDKGDDDEKPVHKVKIKGFWLGIYEVSNKQYGAFLNSGDESEPLFWDEKGYNAPDQPVVGLIWESAAAYCQWAALRLPTEAEWEYAAAAGAKQLEYGTATGAISHDLANYLGVEGKDRWDGPAPVGSFPPNPFGLHDMAGNAWEFTSSIYKSYPYVPDGSRENVSKEREMMVMRGGSWQFTAPYCRVARRRRFASHLTFDSVAFRVAKDGDTSKTAAAPASSPGN